MKPPSESLSQLRSISNPNTHRMIVIASALCRKLREVHGHPVYQKVWRVAWENGVDYLNDGGPKYDVELKNLEELISELMRPAREVPKGKPPTPGGEAPKQNDLLPPQQLTQPNPKPITNVGGEVITVYQPESKSA